MSQEPVWMPDALLIPEREEWLTECLACGAILLGDTPTEAQEAWRDHNDRGHQWLAEPASNLSGELLLARLTTTSSPEWRWAAGAVRRYFDSGGYTGAMFERLDPSEPNRISASDLVAVSMLGVDVPARAALELLDRQNDAINSLLVDVGHGPLHEANRAEIEPGSAADELWRLCRSIHGLGRTKTSKLLARKRPHLIPVWDTRIAHRLPQLGDLQWERSWEWWQDESNVAGMQALRAEVSGIDDISLLRVLDVVVWSYDVALRPSLRSPTTA